MRVSKEFNDKKHFIQFSRNVRGILITAGYDRMQKERFSIFSLELCAGGCYKMQGKQRIWGFSAHTGIIIGVMFVIFFIIDRFNPAMEFLTSSLSKWLMLLLALCAIINGLLSAVHLFRIRKRRDEKRSASHAGPSQGREHMPTQRLTQPYCDTHKRTPPQRTRPIMDEPYGHSPQRDEGLDPTYRRRDPNTAR